MIRRQVGDLSTHTTKYTSPALTQKVFANMRRVGKGFSRVETPLFEGMLVAQEVQLQSPQPQPQPQQDAGILINLLQDVMDTCTTLSRRVEHLELDKIAQALEITKLKRRVKKLERRNKVKVLKLRRLQKVETTQRVETSDGTVMDDVSNQGRMIAEMDQDADVVLEEAKEVAEDAKVDESVDIQWRQAEIYKIDLEHANKVLSMHEDESEPAEVQELVDVTTVKIITETKEQIEEEESKALKRLNETPAEKVAKRQKFDKEVEELKIHLQIVPNKDDDVYTEATPLAQKVPVVDYEIIEQNKKPYYKIIRADVTLGAMFENPDIHAQIWKNQRSVHGPAKVKGWRLLESCGVQIITFTTTQPILLVKRKYPLTSFEVDAAMDLKKNMLSV
nr:hypothetical protein [Tanacetum cinerariifolium]GEY54085.1 hypothetical protein [Tanacetum cinerariifolium]